jgi:hypothetical protein
MALSFTPRFSAPRGATLLEWVVALSLGGLISALALRGAGTLADAWAVRSARDALAGVVREARGVAVARGGVEIWLEAEPARAGIIAGLDSVRTLPLASEWGVTLALGGGSDALRLRFDPAGVGRMASRTLRLTRGGSEAHLVLSAYGRVRR